MARRNYYTGKYKLSKSEYLSAKYYALRYNEWLAEYNSITDSVGGMAMDGMPHGTTVGNPTERLAIRKAELIDRMKLIEQSAIEADADLYEYIIKAVTNEDVTFHNLKIFMQIPCQKDLFYDRKRKFYWILSKKI